VTERRRALAAVAALLLGSAGAPSRAEDVPEVRILRPGPDDIPAGETEIELRVTGARAGDFVEVFADGRPAGRLVSEPWKLVWKAGESPRPHSLSAVLFRDGKEAAVSRVRTRGLGFSATANARAVSVSPIVTDRDGRYVKGLAREDFSLEVDGRPQEIETFDAVNSALSVVLVLDVSASMAPKLAETRASALQLLSALKPSDRAAVLTFASQVVGWTPPSADRAATRRAVLEAQLGGETALYDATAIALRRVRGEGGRRALVLFTDGEDNRSRMSVEQVIDLARGSEASVFAVGQGVDEARDLVRALDRLAVETGGRSWFIDSIRRLPAVFRDVVAELENQYFLTFTPADPRPHTWHRIRIDVKRPGLSVRAKKAFRID